ncbi:serine hydrolase domain-containing protein [Bacteroidota bacterium]
MKSEKHPEEFFNHYISQKKAPGMQYIMIDSAQNIVYEFHDGYSDVGNKIPVEKNTVFRAYSTTKTFTALAIMKLASAHNLRLSDPVTDYFDLPYEETITIHQILTHTAGLANPFPKWIHYPDEHESFDYKKFTESLLKKYKKLKYEPGTKRRYSNLGFLILGNVIENVTGMPYEQYIRDSILSLLDISPSDIDFEYHDEKSYAKGYQKRFSLMNWMLNFIFDRDKLVEDKAGKWITLSRFYLNGPSYGGLMCSAKTLANYGVEYLKKNSSLVPVEIRKQMLKRVTLHKGDTVRQGISWMYREVENTSCWRHAGGGGGFNCDLRIYPEKGLVSVMMMNRTGTIKDMRMLDFIDPYFFNLDSK